MSLLLLTHHYPSGRILALEKLGAVFNQVAFPLQYTPRKFVIHPETNNLILIETDHNAYTEATKAQRKQQMAEVCQWDDGVTIPLVKLKPALRSLTVIHWLQQRVGPGIRSIIVFPVKRESVSPRAFMCCNTDHLQCRDHAGWASRPPFWDLCYFKPGKTTVALCLIHVTVLLIRFGSGLSCGLCRRPRKTGSL